MRRYGRHNYYWYHDEESGSCSKLIPWDSDKALLYPEPNFWTNMGWSDEYYPDWNVVRSTYAYDTSVFDPGDSSGGSYRTGSIDQDAIFTAFKEHDMG